MPSQITEKLAEKHAGLLIVDALIAALEEIAKDGNRVEFYRNKRAQHHVAIARAALALAKEPTR